MFLFSVFITIAVAVLGFAVSHRFVETRLRYVDAVQRPVAPFAAGAIAALIAIPIVALMPWVGIVTAFGFGFGVYAGVSSGARSIRRQIGA